MKDPIYWFNGLPISHMYPGDIFWDMNVELVVIVGSSKNKEGKYIFIASVVGDEYWRTHRYVIDPDHTDYAPKIYPYKKILIIMGMDIFLHRYKGRRTDGSLNVEPSPKDIEWDNTRYTVRHRLSNEVEWDGVESEAYQDMFCISRPSDMDAAYAWARKELSDFELEWVLKKLDVLRDNPDLYVEFHW